MDTGLKDKVAVVFAASRGLGYASALALAKEGCNLAICSRRQEAIDSAAAAIAKETGVKVLPVAVDVTQPEKIKSFAQEVEKTFGTVNILVNNSGGPTPGKFDQFTDTDFLAATELLLLNVVRCTKAFLPSMRKGGKGGRILTITSLSTLEVHENLMLSNSLRSAVAAWSKTLARELATENILVNCVAPGRIDTERIEELVQKKAQESGLSPEKVKEQMLQQMPLQRLGKPEEFGSTVAFLASQQASYISGITLYVDGAASIAYS